MIHPEPHPLAGKTAKVRLRGAAYRDLKEGVELEVVDWFDRYPSPERGGSWTDTDNLVTFGYAMRMAAGAAVLKDQEKWRRLTHDLLSAEVDEVVVCKIRASWPGLDYGEGVSLTYALHNSEIEEVPDGSATT